MTFQHLANEEKVNITEIKDRRIGYFINLSTSVHFPGCVKIKGKVIEIKESVLLKEDFKISPFKEIKGKLLALRQKYKDKGKNLMQILDKFLMNTLYAIPLRKDINDKENEITDEHRV